MREGRNRLAQMAARNPAGSARILAQISGASRTLRKRGPVALDPALAKMVAPPAQRAKKPSVPAAPSAIEEMFALHVRASHLPAPAREHRFDKRRAWRFDFAWPDQLLAVEIEGGTHSGGRHTRADGFAADCEKYNAAVLAGWRLLRFPGAAVRSGAAIATVIEALR